MRGRLILIAFMSAATGGLWYYAASRPARPSGAPVISGTLADDEKHLVTAEMRAASDRASGLVLPALRLTTADGAPIDLQTIAREHPAVLIWIKDGCPCSTAAEPFFRRLHDAYGTRVRFLGLIDGDREVARRWVADHGTPFPVAHDPELAAARALGATNSAYVAVVERGGRLARLWPGFSESMLRQSAAELAELAGTDPIAIDTAGAPVELYTGCPFDLGPAQDDSSIVEERRPE